MSGVVVRYLSFLHLSYEFLDLCPLAKYDVSDELRSIVPAYSAPHTFLFWLLSIVTRFFFGHHKRILVKRT